ncbi:MAG: hypothetical protein AAFV69_09600 [Pseudomonadota bacterium]
MPAKSRNIMISLRVTEAERRALKRAAGSQGMGPYIRSRIFHDDPTQSDNWQQRGILGSTLPPSQVLAKLGQSGIASSLRRIAAAAEERELVMDHETRDALRTASADIAEMKSLLMQALRIKER